MHFKSFLPFAFLLLFFACNSSKERPVLKEPKAERIAPAADNWGDFWKTFTTAVGRTDVDRVAGMTRWPLFTNMDEKGFSKQQLTEQFNDIFDEKAKAKFANLTGRDIQLVPSNAETAGFMNTPIGIELKSITVMEVVNEGKENQTESSKTFVFGQIDGHYKLLALMIAG